MESAKREILIAILIGLLIGGITALAFTGTLNKAYTAITNKQKNITTDVTPSSPRTATINKESEKIFDLKPVNESVTTAKSVTITGKTLPQRTVFISTELEDWAVNSNNKGVFTKKISLIEGENNLAFYLTENNVNNYLIIFYFPDEK